MGKIKNPFTKEWEEEEVWWCPKCDMHYVAWVTACKCEKEAMMERAKKFREFMDNELHAQRLSRKGKTRTSLKVNTGEK